jgi:MFS family permease
VLAWAIGDIQEAGLSTAASPARRAARAMQAGPRYDDRDLRPLRFPGTFAFLGSGCLLALEIVAGRILSPVIGNSLYTWTSVIGVVLAGLSLGNYIGGKLADKRPGRITLAYQYLASAVASGLVLVLTRDIPSIAPPADWPAQLQVLWLATILFFVPSVLLGTFTPMIVKLSLNSLDVTGRVVGRIQAAASLGSIFGVFLTGFFLISTFGTRTIVGEIAVALLVLAIAANPPWGELSPRASNAAGIVALGSAAVTLGVSALTLTYDNPCYRESNYYCIQVNLDQSRQFKQLSLDVLVNGIQQIKRPTRLVYPYERLYGEIVKAKYGRDQPVTAFGIGGGTYTFPRHLERFHHGKTLVAEIDPEVTRVVKEQFGLRESPGIRVINRDARPVLKELPADEDYDIILGDAFADIAIPFHLVTREFNDLVKSHLKPDGMYLANVLDGVNYDFLRSYMETLRQTFPHVRLMYSTGERIEGQQTAFVIVASMQPPPQTPSMAPADKLPDFLVRGKDPIVLTDDKVPVDQLLAPVFRQRLQQRVNQAQET